MDIETGMPMERMVSIAMSVAEDDNLTFGIRKARCASGDLYAARWREQLGRLIRITNFLEDLNKLSFSTGDEDLLINTEQSVASFEFSRNLRSGFQIWRGGHWVVDVDIVVHESTSKAEVTLKHAMTGYYRVARRDDKPNSKVDVVHLVMSKR